MTRYRTYKYPELQVMLPDDRKVVFEGTYADVPDEDVEAFEAFLRGPYGLEVGVARVEEGEAPEEDPDTMIGIGYTEAERAEALTALRASGELEEAVTVTDDDGSDQSDEDLANHGYTELEIAQLRGLDMPAPPPPEDQRTEGVLAAQAQPDATPAAAAAQAADVTGDGTVNETDAAMAASAGGMAKSGADVGTDAVPEGGSDEAQGTQDPDAGDTNVDDGLENATKAELKELLEAKGEPTSGNRDALLDRVRGN